MSNQKSFSQSSDEALPSITITKPSFHATIVSSKIVVEGTAFDSESGIQKVEAFIHPIPFDNTFPYQLATPKAPGDWSSWSIELDVNQTGTHRILARATDNEDKFNYYQTTVEIPFVAEKVFPEGSQSYKHRIALVEPTFTSAAYGPGGFYEFYAKYWPLSPQESVTQDLDLLTGDIPDVYDQQVDEYYEPLIEGINEGYPEAIVVVIRDEDVHDGSIFTRSGEPAYDALILLHDEYVTQQGYDNYRSFAEKGGTLILVDSNTFYAEVSFSRTDGTVTLVKGHDWEFDGTEARKSVAERYAKENAEFIGSNYVINQISDNIVFRDNPFNYAHFEENQLLHPDAVILHDYDIVFPVDYPHQHHLNATIAAYELKFGEGKVIALGIYGTRAATEDSFQRFWTDVVLLHALNRSVEVQVDGHRFSAYWRMDSGEISDIKVDVPTKSLRIEIDRVEQKPGSLLISLPRELIDMDEVTEPRMNVMVNGKQVTQSEYLLSHVRVLEIPLEDDVSLIEIYGSRVIPEFPSLYVTILLSFTLLIFLLRRTMVCYRTGSP